MKIYQQAGHNTSWNLESLKQDSACDGIIFSPVHYPHNALTQVDKTIKANSLFDPQFYVPDSQKQKLNTYSFFPEKLMNGFVTSDYATYAHESAKACIQFQLSCGFEAIVIPARYFDDLVSDYVAKQKAFTVEPFLAALEDFNVTTDVYLSLPVTAAMLSDDDYRTKLLNWVTSYQEVTGVYLLVCHDETTKQITDYKKLKSHLDFVNELKASGLKLICGYAGTEGLLLTTALIDAVTVGAYENTRGFSIDKFLDDDQTRRGPAPRIYFPKLLNWIRYDTAIEIKEDHPALWKEIYSSNQYSDKVLQKSQRPHFSQPDLYKAHFMQKYQQYKKLSVVNKTQRVDIIKQWVSEAGKLYGRINSEGVMFFDGNCKGEHLPVWNRILNKM